MKTSDSIEQQEERKQAEDNRDSSRELTQSVTRKSRRGDASRIAAWRWQPGKSANPGGVPKHDVSKEIAQAIFLNNPEMIYQAYSKMMRRGNAYCFQVLAERAWGKLKERHELEISPYKDMSDADLATQVRDLEEKLGYRKPEVPSEPAILPPVSDDSKSKPN